MFFITTQISIAQSYYHTPNDSIVADAVYNDFNVYNIYQNHPSNDTLIFKWKKHYVNLPPTWEALMCDFGHCYPNIADSSTSDPVPPGDNGIMSLHLNPFVQDGTGIVQVLFWEASTPNLVDTLTWIISTNSSLGLNDINVEKLKLYPNPSNDILKLETIFNDEYTIKILDIQGREVFEKNYSKNVIELNISDLKIGVYTLQIIHDKHIINKKFIKK